MQVKTANLIGRALDYAVAIASGWTRYPEDSVEAGNLWHMNGKVFGPITNVAHYQPSEKAAQAEPIIHEHKISLMCYGDYWSALPWNGSRHTRGPTPLVAAMRCYVRTQIGDDIDIPEDFYNPPTEEEDENVPEGIATHYKAPIPEIENMNAEDGIRAGVKFIMSEYTDKIDEYITKLIESGSGVLDQQELNLMAGKPWLEPRKVTHAILHEILATIPTPSGDIKQYSQYLRDVDNYYKLL